MKQFALVPICLAMLGVHPAIAAQDFLGQGPGTGTCAQFAAHAKANPGDGETEYFIWAQGFMTAVNIVGTGDVVVLNTVSADVQRNRIRHYCDVHPSADYVDAVIDVFRSLPRLPAKSK